MAEPQASIEPQRLVSLDAYRGFAMLLMASEGLNLSNVADKIIKSDPSNPHKFWEFIDYQTSHVAWTGCGIWDLIQPSFMFIVGVAMPYSFAARQGRGDSMFRVWGHVIYRALILTLLGILLRSDHSKQTNFTFEDVTTQLGLGYAFVYCFLGRGFKVQLSGVIAIIIGYWLLFALWPLPPLDFDPHTIHVQKEDLGQFSGFAAHWNKHLNPAGYFDRWFLNLFPRPMEFFANGGGYQTLSFIPSMGTTLLGVMAGEMLRSNLEIRKKFARLVIAGLAFLLIGMAMDGNIWPFVDWHWSLCPIVKRIWSPSWVIFSAGWTFLFLALFLWAIDIQGWRKPAFPMIVVGMNSVAMYVMAHLWDGWIWKTYQTHINVNFPRLNEILYKGTYSPILQSALVLATLWWFCYWLYKRKVFIRI